MPTFHLNLFGRKKIGGGGGGGGTGVFGGESPPPPPPPPPRDRTLTTQVYSQIVTDLYSSWVSVHSLSLLQMAHHLLLLLMIFGNSVTLSSSQCTEGKELDVFTGVKEANLR